MNSLRLILVNARVKQISPFLFIRPIACSDAIKTPTRGLCYLNTPHKYDAASVYHSTSIDHSQLIIKRYKSKKGRGNVDEEDDEVEEEEEEEGLSEENPLLMDDDSGGGDGSKECVIDVSSLRLDTFAKTAFGVTRSKVEELFYKGDLYLNGERPAKKSCDLFLGDEIDLVKQINPENHNLLDVRRVQITKLSDKANQQGRVKVTVKKWQDITIESPTKK